jgi:outer membrane protein assembly factor BamB
VPDTDEWTDRIHDMLGSEGFVILNRDAPSFDDLGMSYSTTLFERRADNMAQIEEFHEAIETWDPNATVFRHDYEESIGEFRSPSDPGTNIVLLVSNWGATQPAIRWKQRRKTLEAPPLVRDDRLYQADRNGLYALDPDSGEVLWSSSAKSIQIPVGNESLIFGCNGLSVTAVDAVSGDIQWSTEFDELEDYMIDSRVAVGSANVYVGLRNGDVLGLSQVDGSWSNLHSFTETARNLAVVEEGIVVNTSDGEIHLLDQTGDQLWTAQSSSSQWVNDTHDGMVYCRSSEGVTAISAATGSAEWTVGRSSVRDVAVSQETLIVRTSDSLLGLDLDNGSQTWKYSLPGQKPTDAVRLGDAIACVGTPNVSLEKQIRPYDEQRLHVFDPVTEDSILTFDLGIGECHGLTVNDDTLICGMDENLICLEDFPHTTD